MLALLIADRLIFFFFLPYVLTNLWEVIYRIERTYRKNFLSRIFFLRHYFRKTQNKPK